MRYLLLSLFFFCASLSFAQQQTTTATPQVYKVVEQMPQPGYDINGYLSENLQYPDSAGSKGIEGRVVIQFVVNEDGSISDCKTAKGIGYGCDEEAIRVISAMPAWKPGMQGGHAVKVSYSLPVSFKIFNEATEETLPPANLKSYFLNEAHYPKDAEKNKLSGVMVFETVITAAGSVESVRALNVLSLGCKEEGIRLLKNMPLWIPYKVKGRPVKSTIVNTLLFSYSENGSTIQEVSDKIYEDAKPGYNVFEYLTTNMNTSQSVLPPDTTNAMVIEFEVAKDGKPDSFYIVTGINKTLDNELLVALKTMPKWSPATNYVQPVASNSQLIFRYRIEDGKVVIYNDTALQNKLLRILYNKSVAADCGYDINEFLNKTLDYPEVARESGSQGQVVVSFMVMPDGTICRSKVMNGIDKDLDREALRVVNLMPKWKLLKKTEIQYPILSSIPIFFRLD